VSGDHAETYLAIATIFRCSKFELYDTGLRSLNLNAKGLWSRLSLLDENLMVELRTIYFILETEPNGNSVV
jgi:hypothetical protein